MAALKRVLTFLFLSIMASLCGCATALTSVADVDVTGLSDNQAMLVISTGAEQTCIASGAWIVVRDVTGNHGGPKDIGLYNINNRFVKSAFPDEYATLYTTILPPGNYDLAVKAINPYGNYPNPSLTEPFSLRPREIKYVGEIHSVGCGQLLLTVRDNRARDMARLQQVEPKMKDVTVTYEIAKLLGQAH